MGTIQEILRHRHAGGLKVAEIAAATGTSTGTVSGVLNSAADAGLAWPLPEGMDDEALRRLIYPSREQRAGGRLEPDWAALAAQLGRPGTGRRKVSVTRDLLWREHCEEAAGLGLEAYGRSRFFELMAEYLSGPGAPVEMRFEYLPGEYGLSDFSGKTLEVVTPKEARPVEIFVCVLACSRLIFACAVEDQKLRSWTDAHHQAFRYFGGCPTKLIIDNLKSGVTRWHHEQPMLNPMFAEFARHYGLAVLPARKGRARDKGIVENAVRTVQSRVLAPLRNLTFFSLQDLNAAMADRLAELNAATMAHHKTSRRALFEAEEKAALRPLPTVAWEYAETVKRKVAPNYHVRLKNNHYSVPHHHVGAWVRVRHTSRTVEIFLISSGERIATHPRRLGANFYQTTPGHMPDAHVEMARRRQPGYEAWMLGRLTNVGPCAQRWAKLCLESRDFPAQAYASLRGVITLAGNYDASHVEEACRHAIDQERFASGFLRDWLRKHATRAPQPSIRPHRNIRGAAYYARQNPKEDTQWP